ncbi:unnamed protein product [Closterium sp. NIES-64]|nr:unnamed protein product [Closterium sp. NIES-64]
MRNRLSSTTDGQEQGTFSGASVSEHPPPVQHADNDLKRSQSVAVGAYHVQEPDASPAGIRKYGSGSFLGGLTGTLPESSIRTSLSRSRGGSLAISRDAEKEARAASVFPEEKLGLARIKVERSNSAVGTQTQGLLCSLAHGDKNLNGIRSVTRLMNAGPQIKQAVCNMCGDAVSADEEYTPCECSFRMCTICLDHVHKYERNRCPGCGGDLRSREQWAIMQAMLNETPRADGTSSPSRLARTESKQLQSINEIEQSGPQVQGEKNLVPLHQDNSIVQTSQPQYGYGSVAWEQPPIKAPDRAVPIADWKKKSLARKLSYPGSIIGPYRIVLFIRLCSILGFLQYRVANPTETGYWLWLMSVICEIWFAVSWVLDTLPKLTPVKRETYKDRLKAVYDDGGETLPQLDVFITTADATKEPPLVTANTILSVLATNYPPDRIACYLSDDGASKLMFDAMAETAGFARLWVPFCKKHSIEPRSPDAYFSQNVDFLKNKVHPDFVKTRRKVKREYEEFKVRMNALVAESRYPPEEGWMLEDGTPWPGNNRRDHDGIIQVFLHPDGDVRDFEGGVLPPLIYVSREKRPGHDHNKKAGAMNALLRASGLITNGAVLMNLDCDHYINNADAIRDALCFFLDPMQGYTTGFVQFPQRFDGIDRNDRYANHNTVFFDINMKGLDGQQGPVYVGTGCFFRRRALYGYFPSPNPSKVGMSKKAKNGLWSYLCCCCLPRKTPEDSLDGHESNDQDSTQLVKKPKLPARLGACAHFVNTATGDENLSGDVEEQPLSPRSMLSDVVLTISCDYEANTDWGKTVGWMYGSVTEDILTGMKIHTRGWRSAYCDPDRAAFKGSAPLNMTDRLHQVERWATGAVEIFFSGRNPLWSQWGTKLKLRQRIAYANNAFYPFTSVAIFSYCLLPPLALLTDFFFVPTLDRYAVIWFAVLILSFLASSVLELKWSKVSFEAWWRNEQFWLIAGISSHFAAVVQGLLKVIAGLEISFTLTSKGGDEGEVDELHTFKFSWLLLPGCFIGLFNILGIIVGVGRAMSSDGSQEWGKLAGKLVFSFWVLVHLYPFAKGLLGKRDRVPTIVIVWCTPFFLIIFSVSCLDDVSCADNGPPIMGVGGAEDSNGRGGGAGGVAILQIADPVIASGRADPVIASGRLPSPDSTPLSSTADDSQGYELPPKKPSAYRDAWAELNATLGAGKSSSELGKESSRLSRREISMAEGERRRVSRSSRGLGLDDYDDERERGSGGRSINGVLRREKSPRPERGRHAVDDYGGARPSTSGGRRMRRDNSGADDLSTAGAGRPPDWLRESGGAARPATSGGRRMRSSGLGGMGGEDGGTLVSPRMGGDRPVGSPRGIPKSHSAARAAGGGFGGSARERLQSPLAEDAEEIMSPSRGRSVSRWVEESIQEGGAGAGAGGAGAGGGERVPANMRFARRCRSVQVYNAGDDPDSKINRSASSASEAKIALGGAGGAAGGAGSGGGRPISPDRESMSSTSSSVRRYHPKHGDDDIAYEEGERRPRRRALGDEDDMGRRAGSMRERGDGGFEHTPRTPPPRMRSRYADEGGPMRSPLRRRPPGERDPHRPPSRQSSHASDAGDPGSALFPRPPSRSSGAGGEMPAPSPSGRLRSAAGRRSAVEHGEGGARPRTPTGMEMAGRMGFAGEGLSRPKTADVHGRRAGVPRSASTTEGTPLAGMLSKERGEKGVPRSASELADEEEEAGGYGGHRGTRYTGAMRSRTVAGPGAEGEYDDEEEEEELRLIEEKERRRRRAERARRMREDVPEGSQMDGEDAFDEDFDDEDGGYGRMGTGGRGEREPRRGYRRREEDIMREEHRRLALELEREREERRKLAEELKRLERETREREERRRMEKERRRAEKEKLVAEVAALQLPAGADAEDGGTGEGRRTPRMGGGMLSPFGGRQKTPERERRGGNRPMTPERRPVTPEGMQARLTRKNREVIRAARKEAAAGGQAEKAGDGGQAALQQVLVNILKRPFADVRESYKVDKNELGRGRFGVIRACVDRVTGERLACKTISKGMLQCQQDIEDVRREVAVMEMLQGHPDVVNLRSTFEDAQDVHLVMELCEGGELFDRIKAKGKFSEAEGARVLRTVMGVLQHCHELGVMHRDLKPENILLNSKESDTELKVIDFGVATFFQRGKPCTDMAGSPYYLAPEVLAEKYGPEADIWSAGVVLYILLCGLPPFWGTTNEAIFEAIKEATLNLVRPPWPNISEDAKDLVRQMLNRNPKKRITIEEILEHPWIVKNAGPP